MTMTTTTVLSAVTTNTSGSAVQQPMPYLAQAYFLMNITAAGNFHATVTINTGPTSTGPWTPIKVWDVNGQNQFADNFSYNVPYDYYIQGVVTNIQGTNTTVNSTYLTQARSNPPFSTILVNSSLPVAIPPGNGTTTGLQFTNTTGAFSLTTSVFPTQYQNIWLYMPIGAFDGTNPTVAGLYYATMSSATVGQVYNVTYQPTQPTGLTSANFATTSAARWLTQTTGADITLLDILVQGGLMGANGIIEVDLMCTHSNSAGAKTYKTSFGGAGIMSFVATTTVTLLATNTTQNRNSQAIQVSEGIPGYGASATPVVWTTVDSSVNQTYSITGQLAVNTDFIVLEGAYLTLTQGA